jgi:hypothetical protein
MAFVVWDAIYKYSGGSFHTKRFLIFLFKHWSKWLFLKKFFFSKSFDIIKPDGNLKITKGCLIKYDTVSRYNIKETKTLQTERISSYSELR